MHISTWLQHHISGLGPAWILWLLVVLSLLSVAVMVERAWFYISVREQSLWLRRLVVARLDAGDLDGAIETLTGSRSVEATVALAGLLEARLGARAAKQAMAAARAIARSALERRLAFLGTLGNNAPFIGLLGTVLGVVRAFADLGGGSSGSTAPEVMSAIAGALVATAVGLFVAIPAVAAYNLFQRVVKSRLAETDATAEAITCWLVGGAPARSLEP